MIAKLEKVLGEEFVRYRLSCIEVHIPPSKKREVMDLLKSYDAKLVEDRRSDRGRITDINKGEAKGWSYVLLYY